MILTLAGQSQRLFFFFMIPQGHRRLQNTSISEFVGGGYRYECMAEENSNKPGCCSRETISKETYLRQNQHNLWEAWRVPATFTPIFTGKAMQFLPESKHTFRANDARHNAEIRRSLTHSDQMEINLTTKLPNILNSDSISYLYSK